MKISHATVVTKRRIKVILTKIRRERTSKDSLVVTVVCPVCRAKSELPNDQGSDETNVLSEAFLGR